MWVCGSTRPGVTTLPPTSQVLPAPAVGTSAARPTHATLPSVTPIAPLGTSPNGAAPSIEATQALVSRRSKAMFNPPEVGSSPGQRRGVARSPQRIVHHPTGMVSASGGSFATLSYQAVSLGWPDRHGSL